MAENSPITPDAKFFVGDAKILVFDVGEDITGWAILYVVSDGKGSVTDPLLSKQTGDGDVSVVAVESGATNGLRIVLSSADTAGLSASRRYYHTLRRMDPGSEAVLAYGEVQLLASAERTY